MVGRKKQRWRDKYMRKLAMKPIGWDEETGVVMTVECRFCIAFGREPRAESATGTRKMRARPGTIGKWQMPFRSDNVQNHHVSQHPTKWSIYKDLLRQASYPEAGENAREAEQQLQTFFGHEEMATLPSIGAEPSRKRRRRVEVVEDAATTQVETATDSVAVAEPRMGVVAMETAPHVTNSVGNSAVNLPKTKVKQVVQVMTSDEPLLVEVIATPDIVDTLVDGLYVEDDDYVRTEAKDSTMMKRILVGNVEQIMTRGQTGGSPAEHFVLSVANKQELANVQRLLGLGLTFEQVAQCLGSATLSAATVRSYSRLSIAATLQMISTIMRRAWVYSIAFHVFKNPIGSLQGDHKQNPVLQLRVRVPTPRGTDVADLHVVALPLPSFDTSPEQVSTFIELVLTILDPEWRAKILGGCLNVAANEMGMHSSLLEDITRQSTSSNLYRVRRPALVVEACLRSSLRDLSEGRFQQPRRDILEEGRFFPELTRFTRVLRGYEPWTRVHGRCPQFDPECPWSTLIALEWVLARRHRILDMFQDHPYAQLPPSSFWLIASVLIDILSRFGDAVSDLEKFPLPARIESERTVAHCVDEFATNSKILRSNRSETVLDAEMRFEGDKFCLGRFTWARKAALVPYIRSLNLSMRRLYDGLPSGDKHAVEWVLAGFVLACLDSVAENCGSNLFEAPSPSSTLGSKTVMLDPPLALPLDFVGIERMDAVDLIESYSDRLEKAYDPMLLDNISGDIEQLKVMTAENPPLRLKINNAQGKSFRSAWECVPDLQSLRILAAGMATTLPRTDGVSSDHNTNAMTAVITALQQRDEDQHRVNFGDFAAEARLHMKQAHIVQALYSERHGETTSI